MIVPKGSDQIALRLPPGLRDAVKAAAKANGRSMNSEVIQILDRALRSAATATGAKFGDQTPAAALNTAALQSGDIINQALEMPDDHQGI